MSENIKSVGVKIGADLTDFINDVKKADKEIKTTSKTVNELQKGLELEFDADKFERAQKLAQNALSQTNKQIEIVREKLKQMEKAGLIDTNEYRDLSLVLAKDENEANKLSSSLDKINQIKLDQATKQITAFGAGLEKAGKKMLPISAAAGALGAGLLKAGKDTIKAADDTATAASKFDMSTKAIQQWEYIAMQSDVASEQLFKASNKVRNAFGDQLTGTVNSATDVLSKLGLKMEDFGSNDEAFMGTVAALSKVEDKTLQYNMAVDLFGEKMAADILPLLSQGAGALSEYASEFESLGYLTDEQCGKLSELDNEFNKLGEQSNRVVETIGVAFIPVMQAASTFIGDKVIPKIQQLASWFGALSANTKNTIAIILGLITIAGPLLIVFGKIIQSVGLLHKAMTALSSHPIIAIIGVIIALLGYMYASNENFRESVNNLVQTLSSTLMPILDILMNFLMVIFQLLQPIIDLLGNVLAQSLNSTMKMMQPFIKVLEFVIGIIEKIINGISKVLEGAQKIAGKGWLWGKDDKKASAPKGSSTNTADGFGNSNYGSAGDVFTYSPENFKVPDYSNITNSGVENNIVNNDNSNYTIQVTVAANEYVSADEIVDVVSKKLATKMQVRGRI